MATDDRRLRAAETPADRRPPRPARSGSLRQHNWLGGLAGWLAGRRGGADLLDRHHQLQDAEQLLRDEPARAAGRPRAGELPLGPGIRLRPVLHQQRHRHRGAVVPAVLVSFMAAYAIVRGATAGS